MTHSVSVRATLTFVATTIVLAGFAAGARAADPLPTDAVVLPAGKKGSGLRPKGVKLKALSPAKLAGGRIALPVSDVSMPKPGAGQLVLRGGFRLAAGRRKVDVKGILVSVTAKKISLTAKLGRARVELFAAKPGAGTKLDSGNTAVALSANALKISTRGAGALNKALKSKVFRPASLGGLSGGATAYFPPIAPNPGGPADQKPWDEPALPLRPAGAVDVTSAPLEWWARDSWVNYVGQAPQMQGGAVSLGTVNNDPSMGMPAHKCPSGSMQGRTGVYGYSLPFSSGWWDAASGTGVLLYGGGVRFYYPMRFDMTFANAEIAITPGGTTMNFRINTAEYPSGHRAQMFTLNTAGGYGPGGAPVQLPATLTEVGATGPFGGMYGAGLDWGCVITQFAV